MKYLAPSVLSADFSRLGEEVRTVSQAGAQFIHLDIMDGQFVPNITFGAPVVKAIRKCSDKIFDVHMMVDEPGRFLKDFADAGADYITIHAEASRHLDKDLNEIRKLGMKAGLVLNPATPLDVLEWTAPLCDMVLLMSVNPGFGAQKFIPYTYEKIRALRKLLDRKNPETLIEIDGGVKLDNAGALLEAGADVLVAGSAVFGEDPAARTRDFLEILNRY
ncbi:MAG: ribulose-phosphate 3-epimerase [Lachnospiraceae bacterium]